MSQWQETIGGIVTVKAHDDSAIPAAKKLAGIYRDFFNRPIGQCAREGILKHHGASEVEVIDNTFMGHKRGTKITGRVNPMLQGGALFIGAQFFPENHRIEIYTQDLVNMVPYLGQDRQPHSFDLEHVGIHDLWHLALGHKTPQNDSERGENEKAAIFMTNLSISSPPRIIAHDAANSQDLPIISSPCSQQFVQQQMQR